MDTTDKLGALADAIAAATGEIGAVGQNLEKEKWRIGIKHPRNPSQFLGVARLQGRALAGAQDEAGAGMAPMLSNPP